MAEPMKVVPVASTLKSGEVARALRIHINTLKRIPPADLPYFRFGPRGDRRYAAGDVDAYIEKRMVS